MKNFLCTSFVAALTLSMAVCASAQQTAPTLKIGDPAPSLTIYKWVKGAPVTQLGHGNVNVVEFWATWCGPCKMSIPHLTELAHKYKGKATFTGVSVWENSNPAADNAAYMSRIDGFVKDMGDKMDYHVAADNVTSPVMSKAWMQAAGQNGIPTAFVVDRSGKIAWIGHPMANLDEVVGKVIDGTFDEKAEAVKQAKAAEAAAKQQAEFAPLSKALQTKDYKSAITLIDQLSAKHPDIKNALSMTKYQVLLHSDEPAAYALANELAEGPFKDNAEALNEIAWPIVDPQSKLVHPDYNTAIAVAKRAAEASKNEDPMILDTYAYALFKGGKVSDAIDIETKAVALAKDQGTKVPAETLKEIEDRLDTMKKAAN